MNSQYSHFITMHPLIPTNTLKSSRYKTNYNAKILENNYQPRNILIGNLISKYYYEILNLVTENYIKKCIKEERDVDIMIHL